MFQVATYFASLAMGFAFLETSPAASFLSLVFDCMLTNFGSDFNVRDLLASTTDHNCSIRLTFVSRRLNVWCLLRPLSFLMLGLVHQTSICSWLLNSHHRVLHCLLPMWFNCDLFLDLICYPLDDSFWYLEFSILGCVSEQNWFCPHCSQNQFSGVCGEVIGEKAINQFIQLSGFQNNKQGLNVVSEGLCLLQNIESEVHYRNSYSTFYCVIF